MPRSGSYRRLLLTVAAVTCLAGPSTAAVPAHARPGGPALPVRPRVVPGKPPEVSTILPPTPGIESSSLVARAKQAQVHDGPSPWLLSPSPSPGEPKPAEIVTRRSSASPGRNRARVEELLRRARPMRADAPGAPRLAAHDAPALTEPAPKPARLPGGSR